MPVETPPVDETTDVIAADNLSAPVFVDATGRRGKRIRIVFSVLGAGTLVYGALVATSLMGGPLTPQQLLPFPELVNNLPVLAPQTPAPKPGAKNAPHANQPAISAKKITNARPMPSGTGPGAPGVPAPSGAPATPGAGPATTTAPPAEATSAPPTPTPQPTPDPTRTPGPPATPPATTGPPATPPSQPNAEGTVGTGLPAPTATADPAQSSGTGTGATVPVGETRTVQPGQSAAAVPVGETNTTHPRRRATAASTGTPSPSVTASMGPA